jgi:CRISPR-associated protein Cas1
MTDRILDFSQRPAYLSCPNGLLRIRWKADEQVVDIPLTDISSVILAHPEITITQSALAGLAEAMIPVLACDHRYRPVGMMLPLEAHQEQQRRFRAQADLSAPRMKHLWRTIVRGKIAAQAGHLEIRFGSDFGLRALARRVNSGDSTNVEAQAARRYWSALFHSSIFDDIPFARANIEDPRNHMLNYGYTVLRASVARGLCACGLHPSFGIHHRGPFNTFPLADDLIEPFRPLVDMVMFEESVSRLQAQRELCLDQMAKRGLLSVMTTRFRSEEESRTLSDWIMATCQRFARNVLDPSENFEIPHLTNDAASTLSNNVAIRDV